MGNVKLIIPLFFLFTSCAKFGYLVEQGVGQLGLITSAKSNEKILKDPDIPKSSKDKIRKVQVYKKYFYKYWEKYETKIYSKTTMLDSKAVTYLVISSPFDEIKAHKECFPIMGCFPYIGFFKKKSAKEYAKEMEQKSFVTYTRPVYAYSTLGYFTDTILSSFFYYDDYELGELIFHELFHTIFFVKDQVQLNENLANYFGKAMVVEYFKLAPKEREQRLRKKKDNEALSLAVVKLAEELNQKYQLMTNRSQAQAEAYLSDFMSKRFMPHIKQLCAKEDIKTANCFPLRRQWNNASLAAFLTYEKKADQLAKLHKRQGGTLQEFFQYIEKRYSEFEDQKSQKDFSIFLFSSMI